MTKTLYKWKIKNVKILYVATVGATMGFFIQEFKHLIAEGHTLELACGIEWDYDEEVESMKLKRHILPFSSLTVSSGNLKAYMQMKKLVRENHYDVIHCHTPNASVITRLACKDIRKMGRKSYIQLMDFIFIKDRHLKTG